MAEKLLTLKEASEVLGLTEAEVQRLAEQGAVPAYQIGGKYLRFKEEQVLQLKSRQPKEFSKTTSSAERNDSPEKDSLVLKIRDFFYFNDFYIIASAMIAALLFIIINSIR
ncbi:MAG: helix-turn-helix domain-containing protein [Candidatus Omnitrophota bacterium]